MQKLACTCNCFPLNSCSSHVTARGAISQSATNTLHLNPGDSGACQQGPREDIRPEELQQELAAIFAAAVHQGWISVQEGICDTLDCITFLESTADDGRPNDCSLTEHDRKWARWVAEAYMDPSMPGAGSLLRGSPLALLGQLGLSGSQESSRSMAWVPVVQTSVPACTTLRVRSCTEQAACMAHPRSLLH